MQEKIFPPDTEQTDSGRYESLSEQMELESLRYSRALPEEEEARQR